MKSILGFKQGMTQVFSEDGTVTAVTVLDIPPCCITQIKTVEDDGYNSIQLATGKLKEVNKPRAGHLKGFGKFKHMREVRVDDISSYEVGQLIRLDIYSEGDFIDVSSVSKGKGFAGTVKRYGFNRGPTTHGHDHHRQVGSIGAGADPGRVLKGKRMPGRMGGEKVTQLNSHIIKIIYEKNIMMVSGTVPGGRGALVLIREAIKR